LKLIYKHVSSFLHVFPFLFCICSLNCCEALSFICCIEFSWVDIYEGMDFIYLLNGWFDVDMNFICWLNVDFFLDFFKVILRILMNLVWMWWSGRRKKTKKRRKKISRRLLNIIDLQSNDWNHIKNIEH